MAQKITNFDYTTRWYKECVKVASNSIAIKRKVGAIIVNKDPATGKEYCLATGYNHTPDGSCCEVNGKTKDSVIHAEIAAITSANKNFLCVNPTVIDNKNLTMFVTHTPCIDCSIAIKKAGIETVIVVERFLKFDKDKLKYDLIPTEATKALAEVLTYGAKKYKLNNWKNCEDISRYIAALMRHLEAYRSGKTVDDESGLPHIYHLLTNAAFLTYFYDKPNN